MIWMSEIHKATYIVLPNRVGGILDMIFGIRTQEFKPHQHYLFWDGPWKNHSQYQISQLENEKENSMPSFPEMLCA